MILIFRLETCLRNAGRAGRQPQMMPQVISPILYSSKMCVSASEILLVRGILMVNQLVGALSGQIADVMR